MSFFLQAGPPEDRHIILHGDLLFVAQDLAEFKHFWTGEADHDSPTVTFAHEGGTVLLELKRTATGWAGTTYRDGCQFGCNLNRVRRSNRRWGLTVWRKSKSASAPKPEAHKAEDLTRILEALR